MDFHYEIENKKLKRMVEMQAQVLKITVDELIFDYINRGLMSDGINEDTFNKLHSNEYMSVIDEALDVE